MINIKKLFKQDLYVSQTDKFLSGFDKAHPELSKSQRKEVDKYNRVYKLRDDAKAKDSEKESFWDKF